MTVDEKSYGFGIVIGGLVVLLSISLAAVIRYGAVAPAVGDGASAGRRGQGRRRRRSVNDCGGCRVRKRACDGRPTADRLDQAVNVDIGPKFWPFGRP
jgi:hypothetical protein